MCVCVCERECVRVSLLTAGDVERALLRGAQQVEGATGLVVLPRRGMMGMMGV